MAFDEQDQTNRLRQGEEHALGELFSHFRDRLWRLVHFRLPPRLLGRVDADDVLQESFLAASQRLQHFRDNPTMSVFVWLRLIVLQTLTDVQRKHLGARMRDAYREVAIPYGQSTSASLAGHLLGSFTSPSGAVMRAELAAQLEAAINGMNQIDREVLALRHFEELTNQETAEVLGIEPKAASIRYVRAVKRLKELMEALSASQENAE